MYLRYTYAVVNAEVYNSRGSGEMPSISKVSRFVAAFCVVVAFINRENVVHVHAEAES